MKEVFIDFDGTICPNKNGEAYAPPSKECIAVLTKLKETGHTIVIYSVRSNESETRKPGGHDVMINYLNEHKVPYDYYDSSKKHFRVIIDDKAAGCPLDANGNVDWSKLSLKD